MASRICIVSVPRSRGFMVVRGKTYISTMQLLLLISSTLPPNWCAK